MFLLTEFDEGFVDFNRITLIFLITTFPIQIRTNSKIIRVLDWRGTKISLSQIYNLSVVNGNENIMQEKFMKFLFSLIKKREKPK